MGGKGKGPSAFVRVRHREWGGPGAARGLSHERIPDVKLCPLGVSQQKSVTHMLGARVAGADKWAVPDTLSASCFLGDSRPEVNDINYVSRVTIPTLMLNGRYDILHEGFALPMFEFLGTPAEHKKLIIYDTDHIPPRKEFIKEILAWLDKYLGPVR